MEIPINKYASYQLADFLSDEDFIFEVKHSKKDPSSLWHALLIAFPEKKPIILAAEDIVVGLSSQKVRTGHEAKARLWKNVVTLAGVKDRGLVIRTIYHFRRVAAVFAAITIIGLAGYYYYLHTDKIVQTDFERTAVVRLPDETIVTLNRNSSIAYSRSWSAGRSREVALTGEATFAVKHIAVAGRIAAADSFRVFIHNIRATVLGTEFNVRSRRGRTAISLAKGKLRLDFLKGSRMPIILKPGEEFIYDENRTIAWKNSANLNARYAWRYQSMVLNQTTVLDILNLLEDEYGYHVIIQDPEILKRKISGTVPMKKVEDLLFVLSKILNVTITQKNKTLVINRN